MPWKRQNKCLKNSRQGIINIGPKKICHLESHKDGKSLDFNHYLLGGYMYKEELSIISQAILNEMEGYEFYKMAGDQAKTQGTKEALMSLANEELKHAEYLKKLWTALSDGGELQIEEILSSGIEIPSPEIYRWDKVDKAYATLEMSIYGIGMQMEKSSIDFYEAAKEKVITQSSKALFDVLIKWERVHLGQFSNQYNLLKEDWWAEQGFAPF